jgi:hypothetical protein
MLLHVAAMHVVDLGKQLQLSVPQHNAETWAHACIC